MINLQKARELWIYPRGGPTYYLANLTLKNALKMKKIEPSPGGGGGGGVGVVQVRVQYLSMWMRYYIKKLTLNGFYLNYKLLQRSNSAECINKLLYFFIDKFVKM